MASSNDFQYFVSGRDAEALNARFKWIVERLHDAGPGLDFVPGAGGKPGLLSAPGGDGGLPPLWWAVTANRQIAYSQFDSTVPTTTPPPNTTVQNS